MELFVGVRGFEPPVSRPPDVHINQAMLHPEKEKNDCISEPFP
jgi:hypothetical protein